MMTTNDTHSMIKGLPDETKARLFNDLFEALETLAGRAHSYVHNHDNPGGPLSLDGYLAHLRGATRNALVHLGELESELEGYLSNER